MNYRETRFCENLNIMSFDTEGEYNTPILEPYHYEPAEFVGFNYARSAKNKKVTQETEEQRKTREAKEYFKKNYNPNKKKRKITSSTYERAQKRLNKDVNKWLGIK